MGISKSSCFPGRSVEGRKALGLVGSKDQTPGKVEFQPGGFRNHFGFNRWSERVGKIQIREANRDVQV